MGSQQVKVKVARLMVAALARNPTRTHHRTATSSMLLEPAPPPRHGEPRRADDRAT